MIKKIFQIACYRIGSFYYDTIFKLRKLAYHRTPKADCFVRYCKDILNGKDVYISAYEETLQELMAKISVDRKEAADLMLEAMF